MRPVGVVPAAELSRVAAEQERPRLWVRNAGPALWVWRVTTPTGGQLDAGIRASWSQALAVGLAALQVASIADSAA